MLNAGGWVPTSLISMVICERWLFSCSIFAVANRGVSGASAGGVQAVTVWLWPKYCHSAASAPTNPAL